MDEHPLCDRFTVRRRQLEQAQADAPDDVDRTEFELTAGRLAEAFGERGQQALLIAGRSPIRRRKVDGHDQRLDVPDGDGTSRARLIVDGAELAEYIARAAQIQQHLSPAAGELGQLDRPRRTRLTSRRVALMQHMFTIAEAAHDTHRAQFLAIDRRDAPSRNVAGRGSVTRTAPGRRSRPAAAAQADRSRR